MQILNANLQADFSIYNQLRNKILSMFQNLAPNLCRKSASVNEPQNSFKKLKICLRKISFLKYIQKFNYVL